MRRRKDAGSRALPYRFVPVAPALATALLSLAAIAPAAGASQTRLREGAFCVPSGVGTAPCSPSFEAAQAMAVDAATGDLLVVDAQAETLSRWKPNGEADPFTALGTNVIDAKGSGPSCTPPSPECDGTPQNGFTFGSRSEVQVVVDDSGTATDGDIYVTQSSKHLIDIFAPDGHFLGQLTKFINAKSEEKPLSQPGGVAVDGSGAAYVADFGRNKIFKYVSQGAPHNPLVTSDSTAVPGGFEFDAPGTLAAGAGSSTGALFVDRFVGPLWKVNSSSGEIEYEIESGGISGHTTVSVNPLNGHVFALNRDIELINEYDASGSSANLISTTFTELADGITSSGVGDRLYISAGTHVDVYGPPVPIPDVKTLPASEIGPTTATLNGTVDPNGSPLTECKFEYGETTAYGHSAPCAESVGAIGSGTSAVEAHADISGLSAETAYHFRLSARNANSEQVPGHEQVNGADVAFKTLGKPVIEAAWAEDVLLSEAMLKARINPEGLPSTYRFEWGPSAEPYAHSTGDLPLGSGFAPHLVSLQLSDLTPGASYHWRVVAINEAAPPGGVIGADHLLTTYRPLEANSACPNQAFRAGAGTLLPDCRAYEMVSPVDKAGSDIRAGVNSAGLPVARNQAFREDSTTKLTYTAKRRFGDAVSQPSFPQYIATRGGEGWSNHGISPPRGVIRVHEIGALEGSENEFSAFSEDLCEALMVNDDTTAGPLVAGGVDGIFANLYERSDCGSEGYRWLAVSEDAITSQGISNDGSTAIFLSPANLSQDAARPVGSQLRCLTPKFGQAAQAQTLSYAWLRDGAPIGGATAPTYTATAADEGVALQCQITAGGAGGGSTQVVRTAWVIAPYPTVPPPEAPDAIPAPAANGPLAVGGGGGQTLSCDPNAAGWSGSPSFSYRWYRNGAQIAGATEATYHIQASDLEAPAAFQCAVIGTNSGGGALARASANLASSPAPGEAPSVAALGESGQALYLASGEAAPRPVCVAAGGRTLTGSCTAGSDTGGSPVYEASTLHALSEDGSRVFWSDTTFGADRIYLRSNATRAQSALDGEGHCTEPARACTTAVSAGAATYWGAAADGSAAIYSEGNLAAGTATLHLAQVEGGAQPFVSDHVVAGGVYGVLGASEDASKIYLASGEVLALGAQPGQPNLYRYDVEGGGSFRFVATLAGADARPSANVYDPSPISAIPTGHAGRVSPDGEVAAFESVASLTGYDNTDIASDEADKEVFRYSASSGRLACVSCNPSGARPQGRHVTEAFKDYWAAARLPVAQHSLYYPRVLSENGNRVFFESFDSLVLADTNEAADVYQWEAPGEGDCTATSPAYSPADEGCVSLISSGKNGHDSAFFDATPDGSDVFFSTAASLVEGDPGLIDVYDARVEGGFPPQGGPQPACEGEACQLPPPPPGALTFSSSAFAGPGNVAPGGGPKLHCGKVKRRVVRHGKARCVKKQGHARGRRKGGGQ